MKKMKNQKGAISLFVLLSMLFFLTFMLGAFSLASRRNATQVEALKETQDIYKSGASASDIYDSILVESDTIIPVLTKAQLQKIIEVTQDNSQANYVIDGKLYTYKKDASYALQNDIVLDLEDEIHEKSDITIYDYMLYADTYNINQNGYDIYYRQKDGSIWKCISYQNIGNEANAKLFSTEIENEHYYGKSYAADRYSILENGIDMYRKAWDGNTNYEFMLMYNCYDGLFNSYRYNRWRQKNNPALEKIEDQVVVPEEELDDNTIANVLTNTITTENTTNTDTNTDTNTNTNTSTGSSTTVTIDKATGYTIDFTNGTIAGLGAGNNWGGLTRSTSLVAYLDGAVGKEDVFYAVAVTAFGEGNGIPVSSTTNAGTDTASECLLFIRVK